VEYFCQKGLAFFINFCYNVFGISTMIHIYRLFRAMPLGLYAFVLKCLCLFCIFKSKFGINKFKSKAYLLMGKIKFWDKNVPKTKKERIKNEKEISYFGGYDFGCGCNGGLLKAC